MPDAPEVTLVVWPSAKTDPPGRYEQVKTDVGVAFLTIEGDWFAHDHSVVTPSVWCDPIPPGDDAPTVEHLTLAVAACELVADDLERVSKGRSASIAVYRDAAARLRRALEAIERGAP